MNFVIYIYSLNFLIEDKRIKRQTGKEPMLFIMPLLLLSVKHAQFVRMVMSDLLVAPLLMKDELSSATTMPGALSVMTFGAYLMLMLSVDNLDTLTRVMVQSSTTNTSMH